MDSSIIVEMNRLLGKRHVERIRMTPFRWCLHILSPLEVNLKLLKVMVCRWARHYVSFRVSQQLVPFIVFDVFMSTCLKKGGLDIPFDESIIGLVGQMFNPKTTTLKEMIDMFNAIVQDKNIEVDVVLLDDVDSLLGQLKDFFCMVMLLTRSSRAYCDGSCITQGQKKTDHIFQTGDLNLEWYVSKQDRKLPKICAAFHMDDGGIGKGSLVERSRVEEANDESSDDGTWEAEVACGTDEEVGGGGHEAHVGGGDEEGDGGGDEEGDGGGAEDPACAFNEVPGNDEPIHEDEKVSACHHPSVCIKIDDNGDDDEGEVVPLAIPPLCSFVGKTSSCTSSYHHPEPSRSQKPSCGQHQHHGKKETHPWQQVGDGRVLDNSSGSREGRKIVIFVRAEAARFVGEEEVVGSGRVHAGVRVSVVLDLRLVPCRYFRPPSCAILKPSWSSLSSIDIVSSRCLGWHLRTSMDSSIIVEMNRLLGKRHVERIRMTPFRWCLHILSPLEVNLKLLKVMVCRWARHYVSFRVSQQLVPFIVFDVFMSTCLKKGGLDIPFDESIIGLVGQMFNPKTTTLKEMIDMFNAIVQDKNIEVDVVLLDDVDSLLGQLKDFFCMVMLLTRSSRAYCDGSCITQGQKKTDHIFQTGDLNLEWYVSKQDRKLPKICAAFHMDDGGIGKGSLVERSRVEEANDESSDDGTWEAEVACGTDEEVGGGGHEAHVGGGDEEGDGGGDEEGDGGGAEDPACAFNEVPGNDEPIHEDEKVSACHHPSVCIKIDDNGDDDEGEVVPLAIPPLCSFVEDNVKQLGNGICREDQQLHIQLPPSGAFTVSETFMWAASAPWKERNTPLAAGWRRKSAGQQQW
ncbi:uncharacterized protein HKW66_Vig0227570 [Vigna angularis]|uniref:Uncharacterized protein n=1 Tax=Phaseolus angularis TaxID=3914 RepID=A0A8T0KCD5_PHAAN|nr:uncharacterized protein HKW66_Vig0227570 [Vigna angularis]